MNLRENDFFMAALTRAIRTGAQTALSMLTIGMGIFDVKWLELLSITLMAMLVSVLTSIVTGLPETKIDGFIDVSEQANAIEGAQAGDIIRFKLTDGGNE